MLALPVVPPVVVGPLHHLPPQHVGVVSHLHVGLHLGRLQSVDVYLEVLVVDGVEEGLHLLETLLYGLVDRAGWELGLHVYPEPGGAVDLPDIAAWQHLILLSTLSTTLIIPIT